MSTIRFLFYNKLKKVQFFEKTLLVANISIKIILKMFFFNNTDFLFNIKELIYRIYTTFKILFIIR